MSAVTLRTDRRATSAALGYVLSLGIAAILVSGLIVAGGGLIDSQRDQAARLELQVVGETLAEDMTSAARLADCPSCDVTLRIDLPERVAGESYLIEVTEVSVSPEFYTYRLDLSTGRSDVEVDIRLRTRRPYQETSVAGGMVVVDYDPAANVMEVRNG